MSALVLDAGDQTEAPADLRSCTKVWSPRRRRRGQPGRRRPSGGKGHLPCSLGCDLRLSLIHI
eukprot:1403865-Alexandrium_andersonii.AAC.1